ncbi:thermonuclease family protein [Marivita sp. S0852]|uniref:thermonuclease family protein n=1 Tax=Marivita sp. S0852 TaxID=3373893 RepID=UPI0039822F0B
MIGTDAAAEPNGVVRVIDGDTIDVAGTRVRLHAIDAPETEQLCASAQGADWTCGAWVTQQVTALFDGKQARCRTKDTDRYGRAVAKCQVNGRDMGDVLVAQGLAFAYRRYGLDYDLQEKRAATNARGLHGSHVQSPAAFRKAQRKAQAVNTKASSQADASSRSCRIKGNISRSGERIFHVPGQEYYAATRISPNKGERWFCTEADARKAGWRKARK